jgi:hypothetical protein
MELVGYASGNFTNGYLAGFGTRFVQTNGAPSTLRDKKFTVTGWITGRGSDTPAQSITLIATVNYDTVVAAATNPTDAEKLALATQRFVAPVANPTLTSDLTLPTTYTVPGTTIVANLTWTSSNTSVISNSGVVTRPASGQPDVNVTLSYVMSLGAQANAAVEIAYTVKAAEAQAPAMPTELFISEYVEGTPGLRKAVEIFNGTTNPVVLDGVYTIAVNANANQTWSTAITLTGTIQPGDVFVVYNDNSTDNSQFGAVGDLESTSLEPNGDDAIGLFKNGILIDIFGVFGEDPGTGWSLSAVGNGSDTVDKVVVRKNTVRGPRDTWDRSEWEVVGVYTDNSVTTLGSHTLA